MSWEAVSLVCLFAACGLQIAASLRLLAQLRGQRKQGGRLVVSLQLAAIAGWLAYVAAAIAAHR